MEEEITLEEYIENYNSELYKAYPKFFEYLSYTIDWAFYISWIGENLFDKEDDFDDYLNNNISIFEMTKIASNIIGTFGDIYKKMFEKCLYDGTMDFYDANYDSFSYTLFNNNHFDIKVDRNYNVEDIMKLVHEFFHYLHIRKFDNKLKEENCYLYSEFFALTSEMYSIFYLYKNKIYEDDVIKYLKKYTRIIHSHAYKTFIQGVVMHIYDMCGNFNDECIDYYKKITNNDDDIDNVFYLLEEIDDFDYHELAPYILGFLPAFLLAKSMIEDNANIERFINCIENIKQYTEIEKLFKYLKVDKVLKDLDSLSEVADYIYDTLKQLIGNNEINYQKKLGEL